jgi:hypothetical protein
MMCPQCNGDDAGMPCAYPGDQMPGCLRSLAAPNLPQFVTEAEDAYHASWIRGHEAEFKARRVLEAAIERYKDNAVRDEQNASSELLDKLAAQLSASQAREATMREGLPISVKYWEDYF